MFGTITIKRDGERWLIHEARDASAAWNAITHARATRSLAVTHETADWPDVDRWRITARVERLSEGDSRT